MTGTGDQTRHDLPTGCTIRRAGPEDVALLAVLGERTFRESWAAFNSPSDMDAYCAKYFSPRQVADDLAAGTAEYFLAEAGAEVAGYLRTERGAAPGCVTARSPAEISRVYVLRRWHGGGIAHALMAAALESLEAAGHDVAWLAVWQRARRAQAFYGKWGFETVGTTTFLLGRDLQDDWVMQRSLTSVARVLWASR